jgi:hypothetical protein
VHRAAYQRQPAGPALPLPISSRPQTGGARPSDLPRPPAAGQPRALFMAADRYRLGLSRPRLQPPHHHHHQATVKPDLHFPSSIRQFPLLNPLLIAIKAEWPLPPGAAPPPLLGLYKHRQGTRRTPLCKHWAPTPPSPSRVLNSQLELRPPHHCRHLSLSTVGEASLTLLSCFYFTPEAYIDFSVVEEGKWSSPPVYFILSYIIA